MKDTEIERLQKEQADMAALYATRPSVSLCSPHEAKPSLDIFTSQANPSSMNLNIELQAKMIEELLVKNA